MAFRSLARFDCDICGEESRTIEIKSDVLQATTPHGWLRIESHEAHGELDVVEHHWLCPRCKARFRNLFNVKAMV